MTQFYTFFSQWIFNLIIKSLIKPEEIWACTTCNACMEACPIMISPVDIIMDLRRNQILEQSDSPEEWNNMFNTIENNGAPWAFSPDDRDKWIEDANA